MAYEKGFKGTVYTELWSQRLREKKIAFSNLRGSAKSLLFDDVFYRYILDVLKAFVWFFFIHLSKKELKIIQRKSSLRKSRDIEFSYV